MRNSRIALSVPGQVKPGKILEKELLSRGIPKQEFAIRCGRTPKLISEILAGSAPIVPETAIQFERVLDIDAEIWMNLEASYQLEKKKLADQTAWSKCGEWVGKFPVNVMADWLGNPRPKDTESKVSLVLSFFATASIAACDKLLSERLTQAHYRRSNQFTDDMIQELTWLRMGKLMAQDINCSPFDATRFKTTIKTFRRLTSFSIAKFQEELVRESAKCGVAVVLVPGLKMTRTSGATHWLSKDKVVIQLSNRGKSNDLFWFNFYHECCHVLRHSKKKTYWDINSGKNLGADDKEIEKNEKEADEFAAAQLISEEQYGGFLKIFRGKDRSSHANIADYAAKIGVAPGILLGQLQKRRVLPWATKLNSLKVKLYLKS